MDAKIDDYAFRGFGIKGYRCFSGESAYVVPFSKVHVIMGRNNSGKSTLADVAWRILPYASGGNWFDGDCPLSYFYIPQ